MEKVNLSKFFQHNDGKDVSASQYILGVLTNTWGAYLDVEVFFSEGVNFEITALFSC